MKARKISVNKEVAILREAVSKIVQLLAGQGLVVTQRGTQAFVQSDPKTLKPIRVNIPHIPDNASEEMILAVQGFIDHEVGHVLFTDSSITLSVLDQPKLNNLRNIVEDTYVERKMGEKFPGSVHNLGKLHTFFLNRITKTALEKPEIKGNPDNEFAVLLVPIVRAWSGQKMFDTFLKEGGYWDHPYVKKFVDAMPPDTIAAIQKINCSSDSLRIALVMNDILTPPPPPASEEPPPPEEDENEDHAPAPISMPPEEDSSEEDDSKDGSEEDETPSAASEEPDEDEDGAASEDEDPSDEAEGADEDGEPSKDEDGAAETKSEDDEADSGEDRFTKSKPEMEDLVDDMETEDDEEPSADPESEESEDEAEDEEASESESPTSDSETPTDEIESEEIDDTEVEGESEKHDDQEVEKDANDEAGVGAPENASPFETEIQVREENTFDGGIEEAISDEAVEAMSAADYPIYSNDFDKIEKLDVPDSLYEDEWLVRLDDKTSHMVGPMQKEIERMIAARSLKMHIPGFRSGKMHGASLHRLKTNDDRIFRRRHEIKAKETAITLLIDNSGSMSGCGKIETAMAAAYALSMTLDRVKVPHEVMGFTTWNGGSEFITRGSRELHEEERRIGFRFARWEPIYMPIFKGFDEKVTPLVKKRFASGAHIVGLDDNIDGESIMIASDRLAKRPESRKILIVLSDGNPAFITTHRGLPDRHCKFAVQRAEQMGIETVGIGIMSDAVKKFYPKNIVLSNLDDLPKTVMGELKSILLRA